MGNQTTNMTKDEKIKAHLAALKKITGVDYVEIGSSTNNDGDFSAEKEALKAQVASLTTQLENEKLAAAEREEGMKRMLEAQDKKKSEQQQLTESEEEIESDEFPPLAEIEKIKDEYLKNAEEIFVLLQTKDEDRFDKIQAIINVENGYGRIQAKLVCFHNIYEEILSTYNSEKNKEGFEITKLKSNFLERIETDFTEYLKFRNQKTRTSEIEDVYYHLYKSVSSFRAEKEERKIYEEARRSYEENIA